MTFPVFFENSSVPAILSKISPVKISAITLGPLVFCDGSVTDTLRAHEKIHWEQYKECLILGFLILYAYYWIKGMMFCKTGEESYYSIPFEKEAYENQDNAEYLISRKAFAWRDYR